MATVGSTPNADPRGSLWRRWDPHVHAPGTVLNDQFKGDDAFAAFIQRLEDAEPGLSAVGITDYLGTSCYESVIAERATGRLPGVALIFPNIEMRLSVGTKQGAGINVHLLVSPDDPDHLEEIRRFLSHLTFTYQKETYACARDDLVRLGRKHKASLTEEHAAHREGVNQFKVDFGQLRESYQKSDWMQRNVLIAVAAGSQDGTSGLQSEDHGFAALRKEIEGFAHVVFSASPKQREFWLGQHDDYPVQRLNAEYNGCKPCLHGSDAHELGKVAAPDLDRLCWIKGDLAFESLRQACMEPESRVWIGSQSPDASGLTRTIERVFTAKAPWLLDQGLGLNSGLVAIIGARGSGKTALADLIAHGGANPLALGNQSSFIYRAREHLRTATVVLDWTDSNEPTTRKLTDAVELDDVEPLVHYLSQQFVERLCSPERINDELVDEIKKVVFSTRPEESRLGATSFDELLGSLTGDSRMRRGYLADRLDRIASDVHQERQKKREMPSKRQARTQLHEGLQANRKERTGIVGKGEKERSDYYTRLRVAMDERNRSLQKLDRRLKAIEHLAREVERHQAQVFPDLHSQLRRSYKDAELSADTWDAFKVRFDGDASAALATVRADVEANVKVVRTGSNPTTKPDIKSTADALGEMPLDALTEAFNAVGKQIGVDKQNSQRLERLNKLISQREVELAKLDDIILEYEGADERLKALFAERAAGYRQLFESIVEEERHLRDLYAPLDRILDEAGDSVRRLRLVVVRNIDLATWAERGESLLDLRKQGEFRGKGQLAAFANKILLPAWRSGSADEVAAGMATFRDTYDQAILDQSKTDPGADDYPQWTIEVGRWLYSTDHIEVGYSFEYDGMSLEQLSPGTRGIVLLLLYLALDLDDDRPLVIDQPEENLDPRSVFAELVNLFRDARLRRQVIIVTHNANLVVNTDVDQVIVADCERKTGEGPPTFSYQAGGLENPAIRAKVCEILEGGEEAFRERAKRLRVRGV